MNYKEINAANGTIAIGYIGDNLASKVVFDVSGITSIYGTDGKFDLLIKQQTKNQYLSHVYPADVEVDGDTVTWIPTAQDTSRGQYMDVELVYTVGEQVVYNQMYRAVCKKSLAGNKTGVAPEQSWVTKVLAAAADIRTSAEEASAQASAAAGSATAASKSASNASTSASNAASSASSAARAATRAETAADSVTMATVAETKTYLGI